MLSTCSLLEVTGVRRACMTSVMEHIASLGTKDHLQLDRLALRGLNLQSNNSLLN